MDIVVELRITVEPGAAFSGEIAHGSAAAAQGYRFRRRDASLIATHDKHPRILLALSAGDSHTATIAGKDFDRFVAASIKPATVTRCFLPNTE